MAQTYSQFKTFISTYLWRENDTVLSNNLDKIIRMADSELNRALNIQRREVSVTIAPEVEDYPLPADFRQVISLTSKQPSRQRGSVIFSSTTKAHVEKLRADTASQAILPYYYAQRAQSTNTLYLVGPFSASDPGSLDLTYRTAIPDFEADDASWVEADYLDVYLYAVLKHAAVFSREEERIQLYNSYMVEALRSAIDEDNHEVQFGGSPLKMQSPRYIPQTRRR